MKRYLLILCALFFCQIANAASEEDKIFKVFIEGFCEDLWGNVFWNSIRAITVNGQLQMDPGVKNIIEGCRSKSFKNYPDFLSALDRFQQHCNINEMESSVTRGKTLKLPFNYSQTCAREIKFAKNIAAISFAAAKAAACSQQSDPANIPKPGRK